MRLIARCLGAVVVLGMASSAQAVVDGSQPVLCDAADVIECVPGGSCQKVTAESAGMPRFLRIDFAAKQVTRAQPNGDDVTSEIERSETVDGRLILQGAEDGYKDVRDGIGWSLSIDQESGNMVLTGSGAEVAFVIFGACTVY
jgi:hypothetical protein